MNDFEMKHFHVLTKKLTIMIDNNNFLIFEGH